MNNSYYEHLKELLLERYDISEADEMIQYLQEAAQDSGLPEEEYLATLGSAEDVVALFEGTEPASKIEEIKKEPSSDMTGIRKLLLSIPNGSVRLSCGKHPGIVCTKGEEAVNIRTESDKLIIAAKPKSKNSFFKRNYPDIDVEIVLPDKTHLDMLEVHTVNADTSVQHMLAEKAVFEDVNGSVTIGESLFELTRVSSVNGEIRIRNANLGKIKCDTVNGDLRLQACTVSSGKIDTVNGTIELNIHTDASIKAETVCAKIVSETDAVFSSIPGAKMKRPGNDQTLKISSVGGMIRFIRP